MVDATCPSVGMTLDGRYELLRELGAGGMGVVFEATHLRLRRPVAIKVLKPEFAVTKEFQIRFEREARAAALIQSPHAVRVFDVATSTDGLTYMVMELLEGRDLGAEALDGPVALSDLADWIVQACSALQEAHDHKIIHRDIKPANIFIASEDDARIAKLLDFGISKFDDHLTAALTKQNPGTLGTPTFMAPEQIRGRRLDARTDIWALGVVLYRVMGNRWPFSGKNDAQYMAAVLADPATPFESVRPDLPFEFASVVMKAIEKSPDDRFASADELAEALKPFGAGRGPSINPRPRANVIPDTMRDPEPAETTARMENAPTVVAPPPPPSLGLTPSAVALSPPPSPEPRSRALWVVGAALLAGMFGFAGYLAVTSTGPSAPKTRAAQAASSTASAPSAADVPPSLGELPPTPATGVAASASGSTKPPRAGRRVPAATSSSSVSAPAPTTTQSAVPDYL